MKVIKITNKIRCELGVCNNLAVYALTMSRTGIRSRIYLCEDCLRRIYAEAKAILCDKTDGQGSAETPPISCEKAQKPTKSPQKRTDEGGQSDERA